jgi:hypothetical protein
MILLSAHQHAQLLRRINMTKQKGPDSVRARGIAKEKTMTVAEGSQQPRAPGWVAPGSANVQSANIEQQGAALRSRGWLQGGGGGGTQQAGWSARQSAQRMQARGEEDRLNASRQSGYGGLEQQQKAGSGGAQQLDQTQQPASDYGSKKSKKK